MARIRVLMLCAAFFLLLLLVTPCVASRPLQPRAEGRLLSDENFKSGDDAVPTSAKMADYKRKYNEWVRFQAEEVTQDYGSSPAVANPSVPCC